MPHRSSEKASRVVAMLVLVIGLVGMHQLAAGGAGVGHAAAHGAVAAGHVVGHAHTDDLGGACCRDDSSGAIPSCGAMGDVCASTFDDAWVLAEPSVGPRSAVKEPVDSEWAVTPGGAAPKPPDLSSLQVSRT